MNLFLFPFQLSNSPFSDLGLAYYISDQKSMIDLSQAHQIKSYYFFSISSSTIITNYLFHLLHSFSKLSAFYYVPFYSMQKNKNVVELNENSCPTVVLTFIISNLKPAGIYLFKLHNVVAVLVSLLLILKLLWRFQCYFKQVHVSWVM